MQEHAPEALLLQGLVQVEIAVFVVAGDWMPLRSEVDANLVGAAGLDSDLQQRESGELDAGLRRYDNTTNNGL